MSDATMRSVEKSIGSVQMVEEEGEVDALEGSGECTSHTLHVIPLSLNPYPRIEDLK